MSKFATLAALKRFRQDFWGVDSEPGLLDTVFDDRDLKTLT
jgi:hypothetical protein